MQRVYWGVCPTVCFFDDSLSPSLPPSLARSLARSLSLSLSLSFLFLFSCMYDVDEPFIQDVFLQIARCVQKVAHKLYCTIPKPKPPEPIQRKAFSSWMPRSQLGQTSYLVMLLLESKSTCSRASRASRAYCFHRREKLHHSSCSPDDTHA